MGDLCDTTLWVENDFTFQRIYSNTAARAGGDPCVPAISDPYYNARAPQQWYGVRAGDTVSIPVTPWSTGTISAGWSLTAVIGTMYASDGTALSSQQTVFGLALNNQSKVSITSNASIILTVTVPAEFPSGTYSIATLASIPKQARVPGESRDLLHTWPVGIYVK